MKKKGYIPLIAIIAFFHNLAAQNWEWARSAQSSGTSSTTSIVTDADQNTYLTGGYDDSLITFGNITLYSHFSTTAQQADIFLTKYDSSGNVLWAKSFGETGHDISSSITIDNDGYLYMTGIYTSPTITFGSFTLINPIPGYSTTFIVKFDSMGNVIWAKNISETSCHGNSIHTKQGYIYLTGYFYDASITFDNLTLTKPSTAAIFCTFFIKYDINGKIIWAKCIGNDNDTYTSSIASDNKGSIYLLGTFDGTYISLDNFTLNNYNKPNVASIFIAKYDTTGKIIWAKREGSNDSSSACNGFDIVCDQQNNFYLTGHFQTSIVLGSDTLKESGFFLAKHNESGKVIWAKSATYPMTPQMYRIAFGSSISIDSGGNIFVGGFLATVLSNNSVPASISFDHLTLNIPSANCYNECIPAFIAKYDNHGNILCASILSSGGDFGFTRMDISTVAHGKVLMCGGFSAKKFIVGKDTLIFKSKGASNVYVAKYSCCQFNTLITGQDSICQNTSTQLIANGAKDYYWTPSTGLSCITCASPIASPTATITYTIIGTANLCTDTATNTVTVIGLPIVDIAGSNKICKGELTTITATGGTYYHWNTGATSSSITVSPGITSTYSVNVKNKPDCIADTFFTVTVLPGPQASIMGMTTIYSGQAVTLTASGGGNYLWNTGDTDSLLIQHPMKDIIYCVVAFDSNHCKDTACVPVTVESPCKTAGSFYLPNAFSPNNDGENDVLKIYYDVLDCIKSLELVLYNKWGNKVFETSDIFFQWNGYYNGEPLSTQVLTYLLNVQFTDNSLINKKGNISLIR